MLEERDILQINATILAGLFIFVALFPVIDHESWKIEQAVLVLQLTWILFGLFALSAVCSIASVVYRKRKNYDSNCWFYASLIILGISFCVLFAVMFVLSSVLISVPFVEQG